MKKILLFLLATLFILILSSCQPQKNSLWENASPQTSALTFYCFDGENTTCQYLFSSGSSSKLLDELASVRAVSVNNWSPKKITLPVYGIKIMDTEGNPLEAAWSNGYLVTQDGNVYLFDYDFSVLPDTCEFDTPNTHDSAVVLPCADHLFKDENGWYTMLMTEASDLIPPEGITFELTESSAQTLTARLTNQTNREWCYGAFYSLQVNLDGKWYDIPTTSGTNWAFNAIAYILPAGGEAPKIYSLAMYGILPDGHYRIITEELSDEFAITDGSLITFN